MKTDDKQSAPPDAKLQWKRTYLKRRAFSSLDDKRFLVSGHSILARIVRPSLRGLKVELNAVIQSTVVPTELKSVCARTLAWV